MNKYVCANLNIKLNKGNRKKIKTDILFKIQIQQNTANSNRKKV